MRIRNVLISSLLCCGFLAVAIPVHAAELKLGASERALRSARGDRVVVERLSVPERTPNHAVTMNPLRVRMEEVVTRAGGGGEVSAAGGEKLLYDNPLGSFVLALPANQLVADDLTLLGFNEFALPGQDPRPNPCNLRRFRFSVIGRANPVQGGGPYTITYALYETCPGGGGPGAQAIPGTEGVVNFLDDSVINTVEHVVPSGTSVPIPATVWLGIRADRSNVGVIGGAPALAGFSSDIIDFPGSACNGDAGGFPDSPHASFKASVYGGTECVDSYPAYRALSPGRSGFNEGPRWCFADDLQLNTDQCELVGYEVGVRLNSLASSSSFRFRLHTNAGGLPGPEIPGTSKAGQVQTGSGAYSLRFRFDPPIPLNTDRVWFTFESAATGGGWILTRTAPSIGSTATGYARSASGKRCAQMLTSPDWEPQVITTSGTQQAVTAGFEVTIHCAGQAPLGACCDMFLRDDGFCSNGFCVGGEFDGLECRADIDCQGDAVCREVPQINCSFPPPRTNFRPRWQLGATCRRCTGGPNDGLTCTSDGDCPEGVCSGDSPFGANTPCGVAACCTPDENCQNLTERECALLPPPYDENKRQWQLGRYCGQDGQSCPRIVCLGREGSCTEPRDRFCNIGGVETETICTNDVECRAFCGNPRCIGGSNAGAVCSQPGDCPGGDCRLRCVGGARNGVQCTADTECNLDGVCGFWNPFNPQETFCAGGSNVSNPCEFDIDCPGGVCSAKRCEPPPNSGITFEELPRALEACEEDRDCADAICVNTPGCENPLCCTAVCAIENQRFGTDLCCSFHWLSVCAQLATEAANPENIDTSSCFLTAPNDTCRPASDREPGATTIELGSTLDVPLEASTSSPEEPGFCCHTGFPNHCVRGGQVTDEFCFQDSDCFDISCGRICVEGPSAGFPCTGFRRCFNFNTFEFGELCNSVADCAEGEACESPECFNQQPGVGGAGKCSDPVCLEFPDPTQNNRSCTTEADCNTDRFCVVREPLPGAAAAGALWYQFEVPPGPDPVNVLVNTCNSTRPKARDSMVQVYGAQNPDSGVCQDLGQCANGDPCNVAVPTCSDGSNCIPQRVTCSISEQACPLDRPCVVDLIAQCDSLVLLGCNDDAADGCAAEGHSDRPGNAKLCVPELAPGQTYFIQLGHKGEDANFEDTDGVYRLDVQAVSSCPGSTVLNDTCAGAQEVGDGVFPFNLDAATFDCPAPDCVPASRRDVWFRYIAPKTGMAVFSTCDAVNPESSPNTEMALYAGCDCPTINATITPLTCSGFVGGECGEGSIIQASVTEGECYLVRVGDKNFLGGSGELTITTLNEDCNNNGIEDVCDIDCNLPDCLVSGCGQSIDCNANQIPDECEQDTGCCPSGPVTFVDPPPGVIDAGWPVDPFDGGVPLGITTIEVQAPPGAGPDCWDLCETAVQGAPNGLTVADHGDGTYTLTLDRPITPGACTTIIFLAGDGSTPFANFRSHPGNTDANGLSNAGDVQALVNLLNSGDPVGGATYGLRSCDINRSGSCNGADILSLIDTLNGAGSLSVWNNTVLPSCTTCQPSQ